MSVYEREMETEEAIELAKQCLDFLNLNYEISEKKTIVDSNVSTYSVILNGTVQGNGDYSCQFGTSIL